MVRQTVKPFNNNGLTVCPIDNASYLALGLHMARGPMDVQLVGIGCGKWWDGRMGSEEP